MDNTNQFTTSSYTGTGSAISVTCGFKPQVVLIANETDGDVIAVHINGMPDASYAKLTTAPAKVTSNGITLTSNGFTVGTDATINESGDTFKFLALGDISNHVLASSYAGTGAALTVSCGFKPLLVAAYNYTDGDEFWFHIQGMTDATAASITTATAAVASQGCTITSSGFTLGTSAVINENTKTYNFLAIGDISNQFKVGSYAGTGSALSVTTGFKPLLFLTYNETDGDVITYHVRGMTDATGFKFDTDATAVSNGITLNAQTVSIGTDASVNENTKTFKYVAI